MNRTREQAIGVLVHEWLRAEGLETPLNEYRASEAFHELFPPTIRRQIGEVSIHGGTMIVHVKSAALRQELMMQRSQLASRINQHIGAQIIQQIVLR